MESKCQRCKSERIASVSGKVSDMCHAYYPSGAEHDGYVPGDIGVGGGDYLEIDFCMECGQLQGQFPVAEPHQ